MYKRQVQYELPMLVVNKLVRHCILGIDALNKLKAVINIADQTMTCTLNNVTQNIKLNVIKEDQSSNISEPVTISRPSVTYANDKHCSKENNGEHLSLIHI